MSHPQQMNFFSQVKAIAPQFFENRRVVEIGSLDINGTIRKFFENCQYVGVDVGPGPGVDIVCEGQHYAGDSNSFDVAASAECFEHNPHWIATFANMLRLVRPGGLIIVSCATTGRPEHGTTRTSPGDSPLTIGRGWEYYLNLTEEDFRANFNFDNLFLDYRFVINDASHDLYFVGTKK